MFLITRKPKHLYNFLILACKMNAEEKLNKKLNLEIFKLSRFPETKYFFFLLYLFISGRIFNKEIRAYSSYENLEIGRYILSETFNDFRCYTSKYTLYKKIFFNFYKAGLIIKSLKGYFGKKKKKLIKAAYIDHCGYINGIIFSFLVKKKIIVYTNNYPKSIFKFTGKKNQASKVSYENIIKLNNKIKILNKKNFLLAKKELNKIHLNSNYLPWMNKTEFLQSKKINIKSIDYIIYAHSFTDGQLWYGNDGFENTFDWLDFTIRNLKKNNSNILIKSHPNFYQKNLGHRSICDKNIFRIIKSRYEKDLKIKFLDKPFPNNKLLKDLDNKKTILISHHGSVLLEGAFLGFKTISSHSTFFHTNFKISNFWKNKEEYLSILSKNCNLLKPANNEDLLKLVYTMFYDKGSYFSNFFWEKLISKELNLSHAEFYKKIVIFDNKYKKNKEIFLENRLNNILFLKIIKKLSKNISEEAIH
jgi:hypothetical protein